MVILVGRDFGLAPGISAIWLFLRHSYRQRWVFLRYDPDTAEISKYLPPLQHMSIKDVSLVFGVAVAKAKSARRTVTLYRRTRQ